VEDEPAVRVFARKESVIPEGSSDFIRTICDCEDRLACKSSVLDLFGGEDWASGSAATLFLTLSMKGRGDSVFNGWK